MCESSSSMEWQLQAFDPRPSLWKLIEQNVPGRELREIKEVLGEDLVDETLDLQNEVETLLNIWHDYREETDKEESENALKMHLNKLPDPPMVRENLKREILLFAEMLRQKAEEDGRNAFSTLTRQESEILEYAADKQVRCTPDVNRRPLTARNSSDGRQTPMRATPSSDSSSYSRCTSSLSDHLETVSEQLNALEIDRIGQSLRQLLREEREMLCEDIAFLQESLVEESQYRQRVTTSVDPEPSLKDLRDLGTKLEREMLKNNNITSVCTKSEGVPKLSKHLSLEEGTGKVCTAISSSETASRFTRQHHNAGTTLPLRRKTSGLHSSSNKHSQFSPSPPNSAKPENHSPSPPSSGKPNRPNSANRFRRMLLNCRNTAL